MTATIAIPVSLNSQRLLRKAMLEIGGERLVVRTVKQALRCEAADNVVVVTDAEEVADVVGGLCRVIVHKLSWIWCGTCRIAIGFNGAAFN